jgi:hypothetical protein
MKNNNKIFLELDKKIFKEKNLKLSKININLLNKLKKK